MPTIREAVARNEASRAKFGGPLPTLEAPLVDQGAGPAGMFPVADIRGGLPSRGSYPYNIIPATDFERATGSSNNYGRYRSRTLIASTHPLLSND